MAKMSIRERAKYLTGTVDPRLEALTVYPLSLGLVNRGENVRKEYTGIEELAASIYEHGLLHPIMVYQTGDEYTIKSGFRRYQAFRLLFETNWEGVGKVQYNTIPCFVVDDKNVAVLQLVENLQRVDLSQMDLVEALEGLRKEGKSHEEIAKVFGHSVGTVDRLFVGINEIQKNPKLQELVKAGVAIQDVVDTKSIANAEERYTLLQQRADGEVTRGKAREITRSLAKSDTCAGASTPLSHGGVLVTMNFSTFDITYHFDNKADFEEMSVCTPKHLNRHKMKCTLKEVGK
jgi:ParB family chromosome partitioning protein